MDSTSNRPLFVVDASVVTKWHLLDEPSARQSQAILIDFREGRLDLVAPGCIRYEVPSAIRKTLRTRRLTSNQARASIQAFLDLRFPTIDEDELVLATYELTIRIGCSFYDGMYVALAEGPECPLIHADLRLRNALDGHPTKAVWPDDWPS